MKSLSHYPKTVHLTFSQSGIRTNQKFYKQLIQFLESECRLTIKYRWFDLLDNFSPRQVYTNSLNAIRESDLTIVESTISSTGVGQQIMYALSQKKPVFLCFKKPFKKSSHFIFLKGTRSPYLFFIYYTNFIDLKNQIEDNLKLSIDTKLEKFNFISTKLEKKVLDKESKRRRISQSELLREIIDEWIKKNKLS